MSTLSKSLQGKYELVGIVPGELVWKGIKYDFRNMTATAAGKLVKAGCPYIKKVEKKEK